MNGKKAKLARRLCEAHGHNPKDVSYDNLVLYHNVDATGKPKQIQAMHPECGRSLYQMTKGILA